MARMNDVTIGFGPEAVALINRFVEAVATMKQNGGITDVQRIVVHPGEVLVVRTPGNAPREEYRRVRDEFNAVLPGVPVIIARDTVDFVVIANEDLAT